ncbi:MAG: hypothetical protein R3E83_23915 [Burkholderiaceae bacterium]
MKKSLSDYFSSWWLPAVVYLCLFISHTILSLMPWKTLQILADILLLFSAFAFLGLIVASPANFIRKQWRVGVANAVLFLVCAAATTVVFGFKLLGSMEMKDGFADNLTIPEVIEIAEPERITSRPWLTPAPKEIDEFQASIRKALTVAGNGNPAFIPAMPSLRRASTDHYQMLVEYVEASPDWHVFTERKSRFAARRWSYAGEPKNDRYGAIYQSAAPRFQTQCLLSLDRKRWSNYSVQPIQEGNELVVPKISVVSQLQESQVIIDSGRVFVEIYEQSDNSERRITKATVANLEKEFSQFVENPAAALIKARARSREMARLLAGEDGLPFRLIEGWDPGQYDVAYSLNPGEPGFVYLKAFEVTNETPLSVRHLKASSKTRLPWSSDNAERFWAKESVTIFEGDWGKPYAARFEIWFDPDSGQADRKLAQRVYKIEGWQR